MTDMEASFVLYEGYLERITYKPGYIFTIRHTYTGLVIEIVAIFTDVRDHSRVAPITSHLCVHPGMGFESFCRLLVSAVREREIHEVHEWFLGRWEAVHQPAPGNLPPLQPKFKCTATTNEPSQPSRPRREPTLISRPDNKKKRRSGRMEETGMTHASSVNQHELAPQD